MQRERADPGAVLRRHPYFAGLPPSVRRAISARAVSRTWERGAVIYAEGDPSAGLHLVVTGAVRVYKSSERGKEQDLHHMGPGESFNDAAAFDGGPAPASAQALARSTILHVPGPALAALMLRHAEIPLAVLRVLTARLRELSDLAGDLSLRHVVSRMAGVLLGLAEDDVVYPVPRVYELAARVGTVREVAARALARLEALGAVRLAAPRRAIVDRGALARISGRPWPTAESRVRIRQG